MVEHTLPHLFHLLWISKVPNLFDMLGESPSDGDDQVQKIVLKESVGIVTSAVVDTLRRADSVALREVSKLVALLEMRTLVKCYEANVLTAFHEANILMAFHEEA